MPARLLALFRRPAAALLVPLLLATAAYWRVLDGEFQFDDTHSVERNLQMKDLAGYVRENFVSNYFHSGRPVTELTFAMNYAVGRLEPWNYHLTNLVIHLAAVVLAWAFGRQVLRLAGVGRAEWLAVAVAGIFALHPIQSQAVSYVSQRAEALASAFYLGALVAILAAEQRGLRGRGLGPLAAAFLLFLLGLGSKVIVCTLPVAWLLVAAAVPSPAWRARLLSWKQRLLAVAPFLAFDAFFVWRTLSGLEGRADGGFSVPGLPPWTYFVTQLRVIPIYLRLLFWPAGQNVDWDFPASRSLSEPVVLVSGVFLVALAAGAVALIALARRWAEEEAAAARAAGFGVLWFFLVLSVTSSFVPLADVLVEHRLYLACWGVFLAVAVGAERLVARVGPRQVAAAGVVLGLAWAAPAAALHQRNAVWETRRSLWTDSVEKAPHNARAWLSLAYAALQEAQLEESVRLNQRALALARGNVNLELQILRNLGAGQLLLGQVDAAEVTFRYGVNTGHWDADILNNLAVTLIEKKKYDEAEIYARRATAVDPAKGEAWNTLGELALRRQQFEEALRLFEHSISLDPDVEVRHYNRGIALLRLGRREQACAIWTRLRADRDPGLRRNLVSALRGECQGRR